MTPDRRKSPRVSRDMMTLREFEAIQARQRAKTRFQWRCMVAVVLIMLIVPSL